MKILTREGNILVINRRICCSFNSKCCLHIEGVQR